MRIRTEWHERPTLSDHEKLLNLFLQNHTQKELDKFLSKECWRNSITFDILPKFLERCQVSMKDLFEYLGIPNYNKNKEFSRIIACCKNLSDNEIFRLYEIIKMIAPELPFTDPYTGPIKRLTSLYRTTFSYNETNKDYAKLGKARNLITVSAARISFANIAQVANEMDLSLHWIFNLGNEGTIYTDNPLIDLILDYFSFSDDQRKKSFFYLLEEISAE